MKRGPIQEVDRRKAERKKQKRKSEPKSAAEPKAATPPEPPPDASDPERIPKVAAVDSARMVKAQKLFDQALQDKSEGNLVSARMNMKLALTFDPTNNLYQQAFDDLSKNPDAVPGGTPQGRSRARELYDQATEAENHGNVDKAIELLEKALAESKQAPFYNRLGVILATKKGEYVRAQELIEKALELAPGNTLYEKNLSKVLSKAAAADVSARGGGEKKGGLLGFLGRRK
jgi:tetratricopeptide (TPR) repeat protein